MLVWWFNPQQRAVHVAVVGACVLIVGNVVFMVFLSHMNTAEGVNLVLSSLLSNFVIIMN